MKILHEQLLHYLQEKLPLPMLGNIKLYLIYTAIYINLLLCFI